MSLPDTQQLFRSNTWCNKKSIQMIQLVLCFCFWWCGSQHFLTYIQRGKLIPLSLTVSFNMSTHVDDCVMFVTYCSKYLWLLWFWIVQVFPRKTQYINVLSINFKWDDDNPLNKFNREWHIPLYLWWHSVNSYMVAMYTNYMQYGMVAYGVI